jgi:hypothetical protein
MLDRINLQAAARIAAAFETLRRCDGERQKLMRNEVETIAVQPQLSQLSPNLYEVVTKMVC